MAIPTLRAQIDQLIEQLDGWSVDYVLKEAASRLSDVGNEDVWPKLRTLRTCFAALRASLDVPTEVEKLPDPDFDVPPASIRRLWTRTSRRKLSREEADTIEAELRALVNNPAVGKDELRLFMQHPMPCGHATGNLLTCSTPPFGCVICGDPADVLPVPETTELPPLLSTYEDVGHLRALASGAALFDTQRLHAIANALSLAYDALRFIAAQEHLTFAECSLAEEIVGRAKAVVERNPDETPLAPETTAPNERRECSQCGTSWQGPGHMPKTCPQCGADALTRFIAKWQASLLKGSYGDSAWNMLRELQAFAGSSPPATREWQPVETAPTDGTFVMLWAGDWPVIGHWEEEIPTDGVGVSVAAGWFDGGEGFRLDPSQWMPLPSPPSPPEPK